MKVLNAQAARFLPFYDRSSIIETNPTYHDDLYYQGIRELGNRQGARLSLIFLLTSRLAKSVHA